MNLLPNPTPLDWTEDFGHENGRYLCQCFRCNKTFYGHKRRVMCRVCAGAQTPDLPSALSSVVTVEDTLPNTPSETPRTDEEESSYDYRIIPHERHHSVDADFARQLERELNACRAALAISPKDKIVVDQRPVHGSILVEVGSTRKRISPVDDEIIRLDRELRESISRERAYREALEAMFERFKLHSDTCIRQASIALSQPAPEVVRKEGYDKLKAHAESLYQHSMDAFWNMTNSAMDQSLDALEKVMADYRKEFPINT